MGFVQRRLVKSVLWVVAHPKWTLAVGVALVMGAALLAWQRLDVSADQNDLFSHKVKFFADYLRFDRLFPENQATYVIIEPVDLQRPPGVMEWVGLAEGIAARLRGLGDQYVKKVELNVPWHPLAAGILFDDTSKVRQHIDEIKEFLPLAALWGEKPGY